MDFPKCLSETEAQAQGIPSVDRFSSSDWPSNSGHAQPPRLYHLHPLSVEQVQNVFLKYSLSTYSFTFISLSTLNGQFISLPSRENCYQQHRQVVHVKINVRISIRW